MAGSGVWPKAVNDILYAYDVNSLASVQVTGMGSDYGTIPFASGTSFGGNSTIAISGALMGVGISIPTAKLTISGGTVANSLLVHASGLANAFMIGSDGRVGVGTNPPADRLDVSGAISVIGAQGMKLYTADRTGWATILYNEGDNAIQFTRHVEPSADNTWDIGNTSLYYRDIYLKGKMVINGVSGVNFSGTISTLLISGGIIIGAA